MSPSILSLIDRPGFAPVRSVLRRIVPHGLRHNMHADALARAQRKTDLEALAGDRANLDDIARQCAQETVPVSAPLIMISQVQRSGGTLLSQLFDGHSAILSHPQELKIGYPEKFNWPPIDVQASADNLFAMLFERTNISLVEQGYTKGKREPRRFRFFLPPVVQKQVFAAILANQPPARERDVLDAYFASYFNAWLNYRGRLEDARYISAFVPRMLEDEANVTSFFAAYPDGYLISVLRDPVSWFASAQRHTSKRHMFADVESAMDYWRASARAMVRNRNNHGDRALIVSFEQLATSPGETMRALSARIGLDFEPALEQPTFNGDPIVANSSFDDADTGVVDAVVDRTSHVSESDRRYIEENAMDDYAAAKALADF